MLGNTVSTLLSSRLNVNSNISTTGVLITNWSNWIQFIDNFSTISCNNYIIMVDFKSLDKGWQKRFPLFVLFWLLHPLYLSIYCRYFTFGFLVLSFPLFHFSLSRCFFYLSILLRKSSMLASKSWKPWTKRLKILQMLLLHRWPLKFAHPSSLASLNCNSRSLFHVRRGPGRQPSVDPGKIQVKHCILLVGSMHTQKYNNWLIWWQFFLWKT